MPFYANGALDEWVECCQPDSNSLRRVLLGILEAIAHLHEQGIVHADVKPKNILMDSGPMKMPIHAHLHGFGAHEDAHVCPS